MGPVSYLIRTIAEKVDNFTHEKLGDGAERPTTSSSEVPTLRTQILKEVVADKNEKSSVDVPKDSHNARTKRYSWIALVVMGAALCIDYSMSMMSIQSLYYSLQGPDRLYGLTFGAYDLMGMICAPLFGYWHDHNKKYAIQVHASTILSIIGNTIYAFSYLSNAWWMMLLSRLLAGTSTGTLGLGSSYIAETTSMSGRQNALITYRVSQTTARMIGPFVGYFFLGLPDVTPNSSTSLRLFNFYTSPGWVAAFLVLVVGIGFWLVFVDPTIENEHIVQQEEQEKKEQDDLRINGEIDPVRAKTFHTLSTAWLFLVFSSVLIQMAFYSNLFALFAGQYHALANQTDQWKTFMGIGIGALAAGICFRIMAKNIPSMLNERIIVLIAAWLQFTSLMLIVPWHGPEEVPSHVTYYASTGIMGLSMVFFSSSSETVYSKKITQYSDIAGQGNVGKYLGFFYMAASAGRFAGPLIVGAVTFIATPSGQVNYCPVPWQSSPDGTEDCADNTNACYINADAYVTSGCVLYRALPFYAALAGIQFVLALLFHALLYYHWSYSNSNNNEKNNNEEKNSAVPV